MRWTVVAVCALIAAGLALYPLTLVEAEPYLIGPAVLGPLLLTAAAAAGIWALASAGALVVIGEYALALVTQHAGIDAASVVMGVALVVELELVDLARLAARRTTIAQSVIIARARFALGSGLVGGIAGTAVLIAGAAATGGNPALFLAGAAAAVSAVWMAVTLARRAVLGP
jgi:hypothetical protein